MATFRLLTNTTRSLQLVCDREGQTFGFSGPPAEILTQLEAAAAGCSRPKDMRLLYGCELIRSEEGDPRSAIDPFRGHERIRETLERLVTGDKIRVGLCGAIVKEHSKRPD